MAGGFGVGGGYEAKRRAALFVLSFGVMSLFADFAYEGARSVLGPWLGLFGFSATAISVLSGAGELVGYGFRVVSGAWADRARNLWPITVFGYVTQMVAVPLMALAVSRPFAAWLVLQERFGKAVRNPPRDVMLSYAGREIGYGWAFGLHEALDQLGAILGPFAVGFMLALFGSSPSMADYRLVFAVLGIPAAATIFLLLFVWRFYPSPERIEDSTHSSDGIPTDFWVYFGGVLLAGAGMGGFPIIAYHLQFDRVVSPFLIPVFYGVAMGVGGLGSLVFGRIFDRAGAKMFVPVLALSALAIPMVWFGGLLQSAVGVVLWGLGTGVQESLIPAVVSVIVPRAKRASAFGITTAGYGVSQFLGGVTIGILYALGLKYVVVFGVLAETAAIPFFSYLARLEPKSAAK